MPIYLFKLLADALAHCGMLESLFRDRSDVDAAGLCAGMTSVLSPVSSGARDELARLDRADLVVGLRISYAGRSESATRHVVGVLAEAARGRLLMELIRETLAAGLIDATKSRHDALSLVEIHERTSASLRLFERDLQELQRRNPDSAAAAVREVVDVAEGGHRYLPISVQLGGVRALQAEKQHEIRVGRRTYDVSGRKMESLGRLASRLDSELARGRILAITDLLTMLDQEMAALAAGSDAELALAYLQHARDLVVAYGDAMTLVRPPTVATGSRSKYAAAAGAVSLLVFVVLAVAVDSWNRRRSGPAST